MSFQTEPAGLKPRWGTHRCPADRSREIPLDIQYVSIGGHVLATGNLEIGLRVGWGLNETSPAFFSNVGVGWRY